MSADPIKFSDARSQQAEMALGIVARKRQKSTSNDGSSLALKLLGKVIRSPKQRVLLAPQNGPQSNKNIFK